MARSLKNMMGAGIGAGTAQLINGTVADGLTATGSTQADALILTNDVNVIATVPAGSGVRLLANPQPGDDVLVTNLGANALSIYPPIGANIGGGAANLPFSLPTGATSEFIARKGSANWIALASGGGTPTPTPTPSASALRLGVNLPKPDWWVDNTPFVDTAFSGPGVTAGEFSGFLGSTSSNPIPDANREANGNVQSLPGGEASVSFTTQLPPTNAQRKLTWDSSLGGANHGAASLSIVNASSIVVDLVNRFATYTPTNTLGPGVPDGPSVHYTPVSSTDYAVNFQDRPVVDPGGVLYSGFANVLSSVNSANPIIRFMDWTTVNRNNSPLVESGAGAAVSSITHVGATATVITATAHGLLGNGTANQSASVTFAGASPAAYNVTDAYVNVIDSTHFSYTMLSTPASNATVVGSYSYGDANAQFWKLKSPSIGSEPGTLLAEPIYTAANRNKNKADAKWHDGVSLETIVSVATQATANIWYNAAPNADATFYADVAAVLAAYALSSGRDVYMEVGNEGWNSAFTWMHQLVNEGAAAGITGLQRYAQKTVEVANYFISAFASAGVASKLHIVLAWQNYASPTIWSDVSTYLGSTDWAKITHAAVAPYYGNNADSTGAMYLAGFTSAYTGSTSSLKAAISSDMDDVVSRVAGHLTAVNALGKKLITYEGGNTVNLSDLTYKQAWARSSDAYDLELRFLQQLELLIAAQQTGGFDLLSYSMTYPLGADRFSWGLVELSSQTLSKAATPKAQAHVDFKAGVRILGAATGTLGNVSVPATNGDSLGALTASVVGATWALVDDDGGRLTINPTTGVITVANASLFTVGETRNITVRQIFAGDPIGHYDQVVSYSAAVKYRFYRLRTTATQATGGVAFAELIGSVIPGGTNEFLGKTATATSNFGAGFTPDKAVDGDMATFWNSDFSGTWPQDLVVDLGAGNSKALGQFKITARTGSQATQSPGDFVFSGSPDNVTYTTLKTLTGQTYIAGETKTFAIP